jgi:hypothetical protein
MIFCFNKILKKKKRKKIGGDFCINPIYVKEENEKKNVFFFKVTTKLLYFLRGYRVAFKQTDRERKKRV